MAKQKPKRAAKKRPASQELDTVYLLKLVLYLIVGAQWIRFQNGAGTSEVPIPVGLIIGLLFVTHDHFKIDRKIELAVLLIAMFVGFWTQVGIYVSL